MAERIVLLHAGIADSRMWAHQADLLRERGLDVVTPDLPGFGSEPEPAEPFSYVERVEALLPATLVGNSFGGRIALETALANPDAVPRLVLVAPGHGDHDWSETTRSYWAAEENLLEQGDIDGATQVTLETFTLPETYELLRPMQRQAYELQLAGDEPEVRWPDPRPLAELTMPTLVVVGERDLEDFHAIAERIVREAPNARLEVVPGARHVPSVEREREFDALLLDFLF